MRTNGKESTEIVRIISARFPKFSKVQLCMLRNPEYGVRLSAEAEKLLKQNGKKITTTPPPHKKRAAEKKRVSVRLSDEDYEKVKQYMQDSGCKTMQEYLEKLIRNENEKG